MQLIFQAAEEWRARTRQGPRWQVSAGPVAIASSYGFTTIMKWVTPFAEPLLAEIVTL